MKTRTHIANIAQHIDQEVTIKGWVHIYRDQGKMAFLVIRDITGITQGVVLPKSEALETAKKCRDEWVIEATGTVVRRPEKMINEGEQNGDIEVHISNITVLNKAQTPPFQISKDTAGIDEQVRLTHRYLDLRSNRMQKNIKARHKVSQFLRNYLDKEGFTEIETPMLTKSTPEGARDYLVPSRVYHGMFYALPQSPQQYKQLLMASGFEKYFQFARCMRDEDLRGDRQPEFTQLDIEMSFVSEEDVLALNEAMLIALVKEHYPEKTIQQIPFPRISYKESMKKYGNDRPDIRENKEDPNVLAFCWVVDFPFFEKTATTDGVHAGGEWTFTHNPFSASKPKDTENILKKENIENIVAAQYDIVLNGFEIGGGSIRAHEPKVLKSIFEILGYSGEQIEEKFGHMLKALGLGTPPHGGIAWGFDRLIMVLQNEPNIREVIAFPKTREPRDPMMSAPSTVEQKQVDELGVVIKKIEK